MKLKGQTIIFSIQERSEASPTEEATEGLRVGAPRGASTALAEVELEQVQELHL